jgi:hypothetical protein
MRTRHVVAALREVVEYHPNPRRADGSLWGCGHGEAEVRVDPEGVAYCGACEREAATAPPGPSPTPQRG